VSEEPFDPLSRVNLARSVELALMSRPLTPITDLPEFRGTGIYAIYFTGESSLYEFVSSPEPSVPLYVGKASPPGARKGLADPTSSDGLRNRLRQHRRSLDAAQNLDASDFVVRYLVADDLFTPLAESLMIRTFVPVWNVVVEGFGNHNPGRGRAAGQKPAWDVLHPGRPWADELSSGSVIEDIAARVFAHYEQQSTRWDDNPSLSELMEHEAQPTTWPDELDEQDL
jgi:hypothetical protein